jgi:hypothetical protein
MPQCGASTVLLAWSLFISAVLYPLPRGDVRGPALNARRAACNGCTTWRATRLLVALGMSIVTHVSHLVWLWAGKGGLIEDDDQIDDLKGLLAVGMGVMCASPRWGPPRVLACIWQCPRKALDLMWFDLI